jgi:DNA-binding beta-propeller fold protein YncE
MQWINTVYSEEAFDKTPGQVFLEKLSGKPPLDFFLKPSGIASDGKGKVYVADIDRANVKIFDFDKRTLEYLSPGPIFKIVLGLAVDSKGRLYVADGGKSKVVVFGPDRQPLLNIGDPGTLRKPAFIALNERLGRIYVTDSTAHRVVVFDLEGKHLFSFGDVGNAEGEFFSPTGIAIDSQDRVFVADTLNARIQAFDAEGAFLFAFGERGDQEWQFESPRGLAFDSEDHLYVAEARKASLMIFQGDGTPLLRLGGETTTNPLGFAMPSGISIDANDRIYITDIMNRRFTIWQYLSETYLRDHPLDTEALEKARKEGERLKEGEVATAAMRSNREGEMALRRNRAARQNARGSTPMKYTGFTTDCRDCNFWHTPCFVCSQVWRSILPDSSCELPRIAGVDVS